MKLLTSFLVLVLAPIWLPALIALAVLTFALTTLVSALDALYTNQ